MGREESGGLMPMCDMAMDCFAPVTHLGSKGYVYCAEHALSRRNSGYERTRGLLAWERRAIRNGETLTSYSRPSYAEHVAAYAS